MAFPTPAEVYDVLSKAENDVFGPNSMTHVGLVAKYNCLCTQHVPASESEAASFDATSNHRDEKRTRVMLKVLEHYERESDALRVPQDRDKAQKIMDAASRATLTSFHSLYATSGNGDIPLETHMALGRACCDMSRFVQRMHQRWCGCTRKCSIGEYVVRWEAMWPVFELAERMEKTL